MTTLNEVYTIELEGHVDTVLFWTQFAECTSFATKTESDSTYWIQRPIPKQLTRQGCRDSELREQRLRKEIALAAQLGST